MNKVICVILFILWWILFQFNVLPPYILPSPLKVINRSFELVQNDSTRAHLLQSLVTLILGLILGFSCSFILGFFSAKRKWLYKIIIPFLSALQSLPVVVYAPLLLIFFGNDFQTRVMITALICFFPVLIGTFEGFKKQNLSYTRLFQTLRATRLQKWWYLDLPLAIPSIFAGIKIALPIALVGVLVSEFLGTDKGIGVLLQIAQNSFDTTQTFSIVLILIVTSLILNKLLNFLENIIKHR